MLPRLVLSCIATLLASTAFAYPNPEAVTGDVAGTDDPSKLCKDNAGTYWLFGTGYVEFPLSAYYFLLTLVPQGGHSHSNLDGPHQLGERRYRLARWCIMDRALYRVGRRKPMGS